MAPDPALLAMFDPRTRGLEIGGSVNPLVPKSSGLPIETADHADAATLRLKYRDDPRVDISRIEEVDHVLGDRPLAEAVGKPGHYDYILAGHVIEHVPDPLGFITQCATLLRPAGALVLVVPDKRRCFDILQTLTSTGEILQAHLERRTRHPPGKAFDHYAYLALREQETCWLGGSDAPLVLAHDLHHARAIYDRVRDSRAYEDFHAWHFTPSSFRLILHELVMLGELELRERDFAETLGVNFYVSLSRDGSGCPIDRLTLARMVLAEQYEMAALGP